MRVTITYRIPDENGELGQPLEDVLTWPDVPVVEEVKGHVTVYLDQKYGVGCYSMESVEEA